MCIIIVKPIGKEIPDVHLDNSAVNHPDGCGFCYVNDKGRTVIYKSTDPEQMKKVLRAKEKEFPDSPFIVHYRKMTHGTAVLDNCHPFRVDNDIVFAHNGTVRHCTPDTRNEDNLSDTRIFNSKVLQQLPKGWMENEGIRTMLEEYIGFSKLAVLNSKKEIAIFNEEKGEWVDGKWYSNDSYKRRNLRQDNYGYGSDWNQSYRSNNQAVSSSKKEEEKTKKEEDTKLADMRIHYWDADGIYLRYNPFKKAVQAKAISFDSWEEWDLKKAEFKNYPNTQAMRTPADWFQKNLKEELDNVIQLPFYTDKDSDTLDANAICEWCGLTHNADDVAEFEVDGELAWLCADCAQVWETQYYSRTFHPSTNNQKGTVH